NRRAAGPHPRRRRRPCGPRPGRPRKGPAKSKGGPAMRLSKFLAGPRARKRSAAAWVAARQGEGLDPRKFDAWRRSHPGNGEEYARLSELWDDPALTSALQAAERRAAPTRPQPWFAAALPGLAATAAVALCLPLAW